MHQNELWWFYYVFYFYNLSSIIYCYCCNHFYNDPPCLYISPTTEPHENEKENKDDKKTEAQLHQTMIGYQEDLQVINNNTTKLFDTTATANIIMTKKIGATKD